MMNEERYVLAELKRWLAKKADSWMYGQQVLTKIAQLEADMVLGEDFETEPEPAYENDEEGEA